MDGGVKTALFVSCVALGGCTTGSSEVKVRPIADPAAAFRGGGDTVALARGQLMIGDAGLALEGFRKAQRYDPNNPAALQGIGDCYSAMGRFDIAQQNYEAALALAPHDRRLLLGLADIFEREGFHARAMAARAEAGAVAQAAAIAASVPVAAQTAPARAEPAVAAIPAPKIGSVTVELPAARPVEHLASRADLAAPRLEYVPPVTSVTVALPPPRPAAHLEARATDVPVPHLDYAPLLQSAPVALSAKPAERLEARANDLVVPHLEYAPQSSPVAVSRAAPAEHLKASAADLAVAQLAQQPLSSSITVPLPPARPASVPRPAPKLQQQVAMIENRGPRLERLSSGEVALVTTGKPLWNAPKNVLASASSVRWVALAPATARPGIQILNAARTQGIAASARTILLNRGWRKLAIGDAPAPQQRSEVLYSKNRATLARRLAAQFGVAARMVERDILVLVLGRDAPGKVGGQRKS